MDNTRVFPDEPTDCIGPGPNDPVRDLPNVILTPHAGFYSERSLIEVRQRAARNVAAVLAGGPPNDPVNPSLIPKADRASQGNDLWV